MAVKWLKRGGYGGYVADKIGQTLTASAPSQAHLQGTQKPTLQKSLSCANAQATLLGATHTHIVDDRDEGRTYNMGIANSWAGHWSNQQR